MHIMRLQIVALFLFPLALTLCGQEELSYPFFINGKKPEFPFAGGLRLAQFSSFDMDGDGFEDLFAFDRASFLLHVFLNARQPGHLQYRYQSTVHFPRLYHWALIRDYNNDLVPDIFTAPENDREKVVVWKGVKNSQGETIFEKFDGHSFLREITGNNEFTDIVVPYVSTVEIYDADRDGDLDMMFFNQDETSLVLLKNVSENPDSLIFGQRDECFGRFYISPFDSSIDLSEDPDMCEDGQNRTGLHGGSSVTAGDMNCDGLTDVILGDGKTNRLSYLVNGGTKEKAWMTQVRSPYPDETSKISSWMAACLSDLDNDGDSDLLMSQFDLLNGQSRRHIVAGINKGTPCGNELFQTCCHDFLTSEMLYFGVASHIAAGDIDADGFKDLVIGSHEVDSTGHFTSRLSLWLNRPGDILRTFVLADNDFLEISKNNAISGGRPAPAMGDLDNDGDTDLVIGDGYGRIHFFRNVASSSGPAVFEEPELNFDSLYVGINAVPCINDLDEDGLSDLIISKWRHGVHYYRNTGTVGFPKFNSDPEAEGNEPNLGQMFKNFADANELNGAVSVFVHDGKKYAVMGYRGGEIRVYLTGPDPGGAFEEKEPVPVFFGRNVSPLVADLDNDGRLEMVLGNESGGIKIISTGFTVVNASSEPVNNYATVYPSPTTDRIYIKASYPLSAEVFDLFGRKTDIRFYAERPGVMQADIAHLRHGIYILKGEHFGRKMTFKFVKM